ncbi:MAG: bifunctional diguanylate cyclase/phosphodiesterase, partial [Verrucomicrobiaceae bacterium]
MRVGLVGRFRLFAIFAASILILSTLGALGYITNEAISSMATSADQMDDARARSAASGALTALKKQLGATIRDNAYWDDAYSSLRGHAAAEWATENWGSTTADYPLYDTAIVIRADGSPLIAYHKGTAIRN